MDSVGQDGSGVQTVDRAVAVLEAVAAAGALPLAGLTAATGLTRPTAHRLATALEAHGLLGRDGAGRFRLGARLVGWGARAVRSLGLAEAAQPLLARLVEETGESAQLYVREGERRVCVAVRERPEGLRDTVPLGAVLPLAAGSGGKVLRAWAPDRAEDDGLDGVRAQGWAESVAEREAGVGSVSAPVFGADGGLVAAISVSGPVERISRRGRSLARAVVAAARDLERVLAPDGSGPAPDRHRRETGA